MKKTGDITTAANSKTLNAVEKEKLYAAAGAVDPELSHSGLNEVVPKQGNAAKKPGKLNKKKAAAPDPTNLRG